MAIEKYHCCKAHMLEYIFMLTDEEEPFNVAVRAITNEDECEHVGCEAIVKYTVEAEGDPGKSEIEVRMKHLEEIKEYAILKMGEFWDLEIGYYLQCMTEDAVSYRKSLIDKDPDANRRTE